MYSSYLSNDCIQESLVKETAIKHLRDLISNFDDIDFNYTKRLGLKNLNNNIDCLESELENDRDELLNKHYKEIRNSLNVISAIIQEEMNDFPLFTTVDNKKFKISDLQSNAKSIVGESTFNKLPTLSQVDFKEGCKCLAFECYTASAFHILRSVEDLLKKIHLDKLDTNCENMTWGNLIHSLKDNNCISAMQFKHLDYIRDLYRNPTNHPEKQYSSSEAENLLALCIEVLNVMSELLTEED